MEGYPPRTYSPGERETKTKLEHTFLNNIVPVPIYHKTKLEHTFLNNIVPVPIYHLVVVDLTQSVPVTSSTLVN